MDANRSRERFLIIANPVAGKGRIGHAIERVRRLMAAAGVDAAYEMTESPGHATKLARSGVERGHSVIVALGGDGTMRDVATGLLGTDATLGLLPFGTGNDFARSLGISRTLDDAVATLLDGTARPVDVGEDVAGVFMCHSGVGFAAEVAYSAVRFRVLRGSAAYFAGVFAALARLRPVPVKLSLDDERIEMDALFVLVQNTPYCGGGQLMAPHARLDDGLFDVVVVSPVSRLELVRVLPRVYSGSHVTHPAFHVFRSSTVRIESDAPLRKLLDGDLVGSEPLHSWIHPRALRVLLPDSPSSAFAPSASPIAP